MNKIVKNQLNRYDDFYNELMVRLEDKENLFDKSKIISMLQDYEDNLLRDPDIIYKVYKGFELDCLLQDINSFLDHYENKSFLGLSKSIWKNAKIEDESVYYLLEKIVDKRDEWRQDSFNIYDVLKAFELDYGEYEDVKDIKNEILENIKKNKTSALEEKEYLTSKKCLKHFKNELLELYDVKNLDKAKKEYIEDHINVYDESNQDIFKSVVNNITKKDLDNVLWINTK